VTFRLDGYRASEFQCIDRILNTLAGAGLTTEWAQTANLLAREVEGTNTTRGIINLQN
jgi:hypothetical protein